MGKGKGGEMRNLKEVPKRYENLTWEDFKKIDTKDKESLRQARKYYDNLKKMREVGINLLLKGKVGTGKTGISYLILKKLKKIRKEQIVFWDFASTNVEEMVEIYTQGWYNDDEKRLFREKVKEVDFLIIDDLVKEFKGKSNLVQTVVGSVIRYRNQWGLPTIITTNATNKILKDTYGEAFLSMLLDNTLEVTFVGNDFRKNLTKKEMEFFKEK